MLFNSYLFILLFLPLVLAGYFGLNRAHYNTAAKIYLILASLFFYGYANPRYLAVILFSVFLNYGLGRIILGKSRLSAPVYYLALAANIGILFYYKYYDFFISNLNQLLGLSLPMLRLMLPLGISFFTFQQLSYIIDCRRGSAPRYRFVDYALFVTYFPQLIAGPIVLHQEIIPQFNDNCNKLFSCNSFAQGLFCFSMGLGKKVLLADPFGAFVAQAFQNIQSLDTLTALAAMLSYTLQIYFDFSGYSDMAMGLCRMMNLSIPVNFNSPYHSVNIVDFWKRWHITLTRFFTTYVYIPLGGNRKGESVTRRNILFVFLLSGIWHGANWTFILWGILHGIANILTRTINTRTDLLQGKTRFTRIAGRITTFLFLNLTWVLFRADSISDALAFFRQLTNFRPVYLDNVYRLCFQTGVLKFLTLPLTFLPVENLSYYVLQLSPVIYIVIGMLVILHHDNVPAMTARFTPTLAQAIITLTVLLGCILSFSGVSAFLYWNF